jgi:hypothetical protein
MNLEPLSDRELRMNQQAATIAASVLSQPVEAATRCEQTTMTMVQFYPAAGPDVWSRSVPNGTGLPKSFIIAVTKSHVHAMRGRSEPLRISPPSRSNSAKNSSAQLISSCDGESPSFTTEH